MATATQRLVTKMVEQEVPDGVILELSDDEAVVLRDVLRRLGGDPNTTRRALTDAVELALKKAGAGVSEEEDFTGFIWFS